MPMTANSGEKESDFMDRCMHDMVANHPQDQAIAICMDIWRNREVPEVQTRAAIQELPDLQYVLSDSNVKDRHGTYIGPEWDLEAFKRNPVAFFNHDRHQPPIGIWDNLRVEGGKLIARLRLAEEGTSPRIDEIIRLIRQGIVKAASIGFKVLGTPGKRGDAPHLRSVQLIEASIVGVGSNPNALQLARSLGTSKETMKAVFGEQADMVQTSSNTNGEQAKIYSSGKTRSMTPIAERISNAQTKLVALRDDLTKHLDESGDEPDDAAITVREELNGKIEVAQRNLESLQQAENRLASTSVRVAPVIEHDPGIVVRSQRPFAVAAKKIEPADHVMRSLVSRVVGHVTRKDPMEVLTERYGEDGKIDESTRMVFDVVTRAASAPATTTTSGWASQLVETSIQGFVGLLMPASVYPGLAARGLRLNFGRAGVISVPTRAATPTIAGSFVAEGAPIPVRQGAFTSQSFTPKKMAVISTFTREISEHSTPAIEGLIRDAMQEDTTVALDTVLLDTTAASSVRPAGIRNGVSGLTATTGGGFDAVVGDLKAFVAALITASNGNLRQPVWIMNEIQALALATTQNNGGDFPFAAEINNNRFQGYPVIMSSTVTAGMVILVDAADFVAIEGGAPRFDVSDQATIHMEDTTPLAIGTAGTPTVVAAPVRSMFQTDSVALRMIMDINWGLRRAGVVAWATGVTW
jgi:HK97 family phage major capsid protein/HK97 family phage prohead protease